jgi:hypothetical protein
VQYYNGNSIEILPESRRKTRKMNVKLLELRDRGTFIPIICVDLNPEISAAPLPSARVQAVRYLLRRCGYPCDGGRPVIGMARLDASGQPFRCDPYDWHDRTYQVAHHWITENWAKLADGDVVDVEFILGETAALKASKAVAYPV